MALVTIVVTATYREADLDIPASGTVTFRLASVIRDPQGDIIVTPSNIVATVDANGQISQELVATDSPGTTPMGQLYTVTERIAGARKKVFTIELPASLPGAVFNLADVTVP